METAAENKNKTKILCIFDGFGMGPDSANNCITRAKMPNYRRILKEYYWTTLNADGESVGQESGLVGNSEVGHMNIGGLQLVSQLSYQITQSAEQGFNLETADRLFDPREYLAFKFEASQNKTLHLVGLFSTGTIHSDMRHWVGSIEAAGRAGASRIVLHLITDGRDSDRRSLVATWQEFVTKFEDRLQPYISLIFLGSVGGRFYAMDRDGNWERVIAQVAPWFSLVIKENNKGEFGIPEFVQKKYGQEVLQKSNELVQKLTDNLKNLLLTIDQRNELQKLSAENVLKLLKSGTSINLMRIIDFLGDYTNLNYGQEIFDETLIPATVHQIQKNETVWLLNFRSDRMKQLTTLLCDLNGEFDLDLDIISMNDYGIGREVFCGGLSEKESQVLGENSPFSTPETTFDKFTTNHTGYKPIFQSKPVQNTLAETISNLGQTQLHIAETEKYAHVTYFLNGSKETKHEGEDWMVIPSNKVDSHAQMPQMKAKEITDYILDCLDFQIYKNSETQMSSSETTPSKFGGYAAHYDHIIVNYANPDMVSHTGDIQASIESMEFLDQQFGRLLYAVEQAGHSLILIADHGNMEFVGEFEQNGKSLTDTEHNPNAVPCVIVDSRFKVDSGLDKGLNLKNTSELIDKVENLNLKIDKKLLQKVLGQKNYQNLDDDWLSSDEIEKITAVQLPLWYAGVLLLSL